MSDEEIMKKFAESFSNEKNEDVSPYKATSNLNKEISNPNMLVNDKMNLNIKEENIDDTTDNIDIITLDDEKKDTQPIGKVSNQKPPKVKKEAKVTKPQYKFINKNETKPEKKLNINFNITNETKIALLIALVLFVVIMLIPGVHDFFRSIVS